MEESVRQLKDWLNDEEHHAAPWSVQVDDKATQATIMMARLGTDALLVLDGGDVVGMISALGILQQLVINGRDPNTLCVKDIMVEVPFVKATACVEAARRACRQLGRRRICIVKGDQVEGLVTSAELAHTVADDEGHHISELTSYITGMPGGMPRRRCNAGTPVGFISESQRIALTKSNTRKPTLPQMKLGARPKA